MWFLMTKKLRSVGGFSLSELLLTMLIILLMTQLTVDGIPAVRRAYNRAVDAANAEVYLNTTIIALRSRLSLAYDAQSNDENTELTYTDPEIGRCKIRNSENGIQIQVYLGIDMTALPVTKPLAPDTAEGFISSYSKIEYTKDESANKASFTITGLTVKKDGEELANLDKPYIIHTVNP